MMDDKRNSCAAAMLLSSGLKPAFMALLLLVAFIICRNAAAQEKEKPLQLDENQILVQEQGVALESTVDPERYYVGPSDLISVNIWMSPPLNLVLSVTPEGTLIIPTVGEVQVAGLTLSKAKEMILAEARKKYRTTEISTTLIKPRPIIVMVTGNVLNQGLYTLTAVDRATKALEEANKPTRTQKQEDILPVLNEMSTRNIILTHRDGTQNRVDLIKFNATKKEVWNPYLREGDIVIVPRKNREKNVFGIYGEVNAPGRYEFVEGDSLVDALQIGQGFTRLALLDSVEFSRLSRDATSITQQIIDMRNILSTQNPNFPLEPGDRVVVKANRELREDYVVTIRGEVVYPGTYPITKNHTRLSDIIRQAGGFTEFASLQSSELNRRSVQETDIMTERLMSLRGAVSTQDSADYSVETDLRIHKEIVNVDFSKLFSEGDSAQDVILQDGDYVTVPSVKKTIYVFGQIVSPGHIPFVKDKGPEYYVNKAGGFTGRAREGDLKIIKSKTKQWLSPNETSIEEGDYIWVPKDPERSFAYYMSIIGQTSSIVAVAVSVVLLVIQSRK